MSEEKPLRVRVAEAMGKRCQRYSGMDRRERWYTAETMDTIPDYGGPNPVATFEMLEWIENYASMEEEDRLLDQLKDLWVGNWHRAIARCVLAVAERTHADG